MMLFDTVDASGTRMTRDGYLVAEARVARTGIQLYSAGELGMTGDASRVVRVYRPAEEVFHEDAMASYAHRPVTSDHPSEMVDAKNWKQYAKGQTGDEVMRDGEFVRVPIMLLDAGAIADMNNGKRELSMGYTMDLDTTAGTTPDGEQYDAVQRKLRMNHLALVPRARGGAQLKMGDNHEEDSTMSEVKLQTVTVDGLSVQTTDAGAQAISKLTGELQDARTALTAAETTHKTTLATKDAELATKDAKIDDLTGKQLSDADLDAKVTERADLIATAKGVADLDYTGKSAADIRSTAVAANLGQTAIDGKSVEYVAARFDILAEDSTQDPVRRTLRSVDNKPAVNAETAHAKMVSDMSNAYKGVAS